MSQNPQYDDSDGTTGENANKRGDNRQMRAGRPKVGQAPTQSYLSIQDLDRLLWSDNARAHYGLKPRGSK